MAWPDDPAPKCPGRQPTFHHPLGGPCGNPMTKLTGERWLCLRCGKEIDGSERRGPAPGSRAVGVENQTAEQGPKAHRRTDTDRVSQCGTLESEEKTGRS